MALNSGILDCSYDSTIYITSEKEAAELLYTPVEVVFASIIVPCMMAISFLSNSAFIYTVYCMPELHTITNAYLVNMAVADIIYVNLGGTLVFLLPYMMSSVKDDVHYGFIGCFSRGLVSNSCYFASFILVTCVAVERFLAICHPLYQQMVSGKSRTIKIIVTSWLLAGIFAVTVYVPQYSNLKTVCIYWPLGKAYSILPMKFSSCSTLPGFPVVFSQVADTILYFLALVLNFIVYAKIIITLKRRATQDLGTRTQHKARREHNQVARLLITNGVVFFLCFTPWQFTNFDSITTYLTGSHLFIDINYRYIQIVALFMSYVNSSINPFVYITCSSTYRIACMKAFGLKCNK